VDEKPGSRSRPGRNRPIGGQHLSNAVLDVEKLDTGTQDACQPADAGQRHASNLLGGLRGQDGPIDLVEHLKLFAVTL